MLGRNLGRRPSSLSGQAIIDSTGNLERESERKHLSLSSLPRVVDDPSVIFEGIEGRMILRSTFVGSAYGQSSVLAGRAVDRRQDPFEYEKYQNLVANTLQNNTGEWPGFRDLPQQERTLLPLLVRQICDLAGPMNWPHLELIRPVTNFLLEYMNYFPDCFEDCHLPTSWGVFIASEAGKQLSKCHLSLPVKDSCVRSASTANT
jgi:hypothetical protein